MLAFAEKNRLRIRDDQRITDYSRPGGNVEVARKILPFTVAAQSAGRFHAECSEDAT